MHKHKYTQTHKNIPIYTQKNTHTPRHTHTHIHTHTFLHTPICTLMHTHTPTQTMCSLQQLLNQNNENEISSHDSIVQVKGDRKGSLQ